MNEPDDKLRARLRALAAHEALPVLTASQRVQAERAAEAAVPLRKPTSGRLLALSFSCSLVLAGAVFWLVSADTPPLASRVAVTTHDPSPDPRHVPATVPSARCAPFSKRVLGAAAQLELGKRALFSTARTGQVTISLSPDCDLTVELHAGDVFVQARDLEGRSLRVVTAHGEVEVRGTVFAVHTDASGFAVDVDEGRVEVRAHDGRALVLSAGDSVRANAAQPLQKRELSLARRNQVRAALGLSPRRVPPGRAAHDAGALTTDAAGEQIWHLGSVPTPSSPPELKTSVTEDGHPMQKPHVEPGD